MIKEELLQNLTDKDVKTIKKALVLKDWTIEQIRYMIFLMNRPKSDRKGKRKSTFMSKEEYAEKTGTNRTKLYTWEAKPGFNEAKLSLYAAFFLEQDIEVDKELYKKAMAGNVPAMRLYYERKGLLGQVADTGIVQILIERSTIKKDKK